MVKSPSSDSATRQEMVKVDTFANGHICNPAGLMHGQRPEGLLLREDEWPRLCALKSTGLHPNPHRALDTVGGQDSVMVVPLDITDYNLQSFSKESRTHLSSDQGGVVNLAAPTPVKPGQVYRVYIDIAENLSLVKVGMFPKKVSPKSWQTLWA